MNKTEQAAKKIDSYNNAQNEGGDGYNPHQAEHDAAVEEAAEARIRHIIENLDSYKAAWNAAVAKHTTAKGVPAAAIKAIEAAAGVTLNEMQIVKSRCAK